MTCKKAWYIFCLLLCNGGCKRAQFIKKHNLFGSMGYNSYFHPYWMPSDPKRIFIGENVWVAANVVFINHDIANGMLQNIEKRKYNQLFENIVIGNNVLIGANSIILPGITVGDNCVIGAGTVVSRNVKSGTVVGGNPIKEIGEFQKFEKKRREYVQKVVE